jgi:hypothetical protein
MGFSGTTGDLFRKAMRRPDGRADVPPHLMTEETDQIIRTVRPFTMTSVERLLALTDAVEYLTKHNVPGSIVECGVWRGGSMMAIALALRNLGALRELYLYDTFEGMTPPTEVDREYTGRSAVSMLEADADRTGTAWAIAPLDTVERNMQSTGYPRERIHYVKGPVEATLPDGAPDTIALLRLDTDWYGSTRHEMVHLLPRVVSGGILIVDDYGHFEGARKAVDEYVSETGIRLFLARLDYTGRLAILP